MSSLTKQERIRRFYQEEKLMEMGFTSREAEQLRRISNQLQHWYERECNGTVERDEITNKTFSVMELHNGKLLRHRCNDLETGAIKRLDALMSNHPEWIYYLQTDPRGASLYLLDAKGNTSQEWISGNYSSYGVCVY